MIEFSRSQLRQVTGVSDNTFQHWIREKVIVPIPSTEGGGTGRQRKYDREEVIVTKILAAADSLNVRVETLRDIASVIRTALKTPTRLAINESYKDVEVACLHYILSADDPDALNKVPEALRDLHHEDWQLLGAWSVLESARQEKREAQSILSVFSLNGETLIAGLNPISQKKLPEGVEAFIGLNINEILFGLNI